VYASKEASGFRSVPRVHDVPIYPLRLAASCCSTDCLLRRCRTVCSQRISLLTLLVNRDGTSGQAREEVAASVNGYTNISTLLANSDVLSVSAQRTGGAGGG
jgi:hypothetical protein